MGYRILEKYDHEGNKEFIPQRRGWFFWHGCSITVESDIDGFDYPEDAIFTTLSDAKQYIDAKIRSKLAPVIHEYPVDTNTNKDGSGYIPKMSSCKQPKPPGEE